MQRSSTNRTNRNREEELDNVIYLDQATAATMNMLRDTIAYDKRRNKNGKFDENIARDEDTLRSFFDQVLKRKEAA